MEFFKDVELTEGRMAIENPCGETFSWPLEEENENINNRVWCGDTFLTNG